MGIRHGRTSPVETKFRGKIHATWTSSLDTCRGWGLENAAWKNANISLPTVINKYLSFLFYHVNYDERL